MTTTRLPYHAYNQNVARQMACLTEIVQLNPVLKKVFDQAPDLGLESYYVGAGCIAQSVWNYVSGFPADRGISDIDFVYYDPNLSYDKENEVIVRVQALYRGIPIQMDVKNQARVHLWYERHFGYPIEPYGSVEAAINTWPTTATAVGIRRHADGEWHVYAPYGLNDLFGLIVRPNKTQITKEIYERKTARWAQIWPQLTIIPW